LDIKPSQEAINIITYSIEKYIDDNKILNINDNLYSKIFMSDTTSNNEFLKICDNTLYAMIGKNIEIC
jgi:hypothetical protein